MAPSSSKQKVGDILERTILESSLFNRLPSDACPFVSAFKRLKRWRAVFPLAAPKVAIR